MVLVDLVVGDVSPCKVVREDGARPEAGGVPLGEFGNDFGEEVGGLDEVVFIGDVGVAGAAPVTVPWGFGITVAAGHFCDGGSAG